MNKARYTPGLILLILLASLITWPTGQAITPQQQTISITDTHDDKFITEAGIGIDAWLCHILDPDMDIRSYLVFRELEINWWEPLKNATLRLRTTVNLDFEADSSVTIYGMKFSDLQDEGVITTNFVLSVPLTSAYVSVNTSQFYGQQWHEVNVTNIVEELKQSINWDGDGHAGTETGDAIGFVIFGAEGYDTRWFIDYHYGTPSLASQLVIHWNHEPPPPVGYEEYEFDQTYGNHTIWVSPEGFGYSLNPMEYIFLDSSTAKYDSVEGVGPYTISTVKTLNYNGPRKLVRMSNGTLFAVYDSPVANTQIHIKHSDDDGATWIGDTTLSTVSGQDDDQRNPSLAVDSQNNLHVVWRGKSDSHPTYWQIWYTTYTDSWSTPIRISTDSGWAKEYPVIAVDSYDGIHVAYSGQHKIGANWWYQIWHTIYTSSWSTPIRISTLGGMNEKDQHHLSIALDSNDYINIVWTGRHTTYGNNKQIWYALNDGSWNNPVRISTTSGMQNFDQEYPCITLQSNDQLHVVFEGDTYGGDDKIHYTTYTDSWQTPYLISSGAGPFAYPNIASDSDDVLHVMWSSCAYRNYTTGWGSILDLQTPGELPNLRWGRWPQPRNATYIIVDANGTVIMDNGDPLIFDDPEDAQDWIDIEDPDPEDPDPGDQWSEGPGGATGPLTRFRMRLYFLVVGMGCLFGPILFFASKRPSGYYILCGFIIMLMGIGLLMSIGQV